MDKAHTSSEAKSFESLSELNRSFFTEQSFLSMLRASPSVGPMLSLQASPSQQARSPSLNAVNTPETLDGYLCVPLLHSMFSTPEVFLQKNQKALCFERVFRELDAGELSWDMSLIKPEGNSPKVCVDPSVLEQTWSPRLQLSLSAEESLGGSD